MCYGRQWPPSARLLFELSDDLKKMHGAVHAASLRWVLVTDVAAGSDRAVWDGHVVESSSRAYVRLRLLTTSCLQDK